MPPETFSLETEGELPMRSGRPKAALVLNAEEQTVLSQWARRRKTAQALALRARIVLACSENLSNHQVAAELGITQQTVGKWRQRFVRDRLCRLLRRTPSGAPPPAFGSAVQRDLYP